MADITKIARSLRINIFILLCTWVVSTALLYSSITEPNGLVKLAIIWIPSIVTVITVIVYYLSRLVIKPYSWIITLLGVLIMLYISIPIFFGIDM